MIRQRWPILSDDELKFSVSTGVDAGRYELNTTREIVITQPGRLSYQECIDLSNANAPPPTQLEPITEADFYAIFGFSKI